MRIQKRYIERYTISDKKKNRKKVLNFLHKNLFTITSLKAGGRGRFKKDLSKILIIAEREINKPITLDSKEKGENNENNK